MAQDLLSSRTPDTLPSQPQPEQHSQLQQAPERRTATQRLLEEQSSLIAQALCSCGSHPPDLVTVFSRFASSDFVYVTQQNIPRPTSQDLKKSEALAYLERAVTKIKLEGRQDEGEFWNVSSLVEDELGFATGMYGCAKVVERGLMVPIVIVWITAVADWNCDWEGGGRRERVGIFAWKWESGGWKWWRHSCFLAVPVGV